MKKTMSHHRLSLFASGLLAALTVAVAAAPAPAGSAAANAPAKDVAASAAAKEEPFKEQSFYVPYEKLRKTFEKEGRGVFLPYEQFRRLWEAARGRTPEPPPPVPPVANLVTEVSGEATISQDVMRVRAKVRIELLQAGWHTVPLALADVAVTSATLGEEPARLVSETGTGYALLVENPDKAPRVLELDLEFAKAYTKAPGRNSVAFSAPPAPVSRWDVRIPEAGVKVDIQPLLAATEAPPTHGKNETRILAFVGAAPSIRLEWTPKAEGARGLAALAAAQAEQRVWLEEGVSRTRVELLYTISRAELSELTVEVPAGQKVVNVFDPNVREWSVADQAGAQRITTQLFEPARTSQKLVVELERFAADRQVSIPLIQALGVGRQQGVVVVAVAAGLRAEASRRQGLLQLDAAELPPALRGEKWDFSYRYAALPFDLQLDVEKIQPRIVVDGLVEAHLEPEALTLDFVALYDVQRAGVFRLPLQIPSGFEVRQVHGKAIDDATPAEVDTHDLDANQPGRLIVHLARQARGHVGLAVQLQRRLQEPDLLTPTGRAALVPIPIPRPAEGTVWRDTGRLVVYGPESLRVNATKTMGLRAIPHSEAVAGMPSTQHQRGERPVLAFAFATDPAELELRAERRKPHITVRQLLTARIESGVVKFRASLFYDILYSGVKWLRVDVPTELADQIRVTSPGLQHAVFEDPGALPELAEGYTAWRLTGETEFSGTARADMVWERKIERLDVGEGVDIAIPCLLPRAVDRAWGQIVLTKAESIDVIPADARAGLRPIDPQHDLMPGAAISDAARAFEFHDAWQLTVKATRYEAQDLKATSVERGLVRMVVTRGDLTSVQAIYRMRSVRQRLVIELPGTVSFDTQPLRLNGRPVALEQGSGQEYFVPLVGMQPNQPFLLELRYVLRGSGLDLECPSFPREPAIQKIFLSAYLPKELAFLGSRGPWTDEFVWVLRGFSTWPRGNRHGGALVDWVTEGLPVNKDALNSFATDGRRLLFSTLRPEAGADGTLRITAVPRLLLNLVVLVIGVGLGLALVPRPARERTLVVGVVLVGMVLAAVFLPSLTRALINNATVAGAFIVLIIWGLHYILVRKPRTRAAAETQTEAAAPEAADSDPTPRQTPPELPTNTAPEADEPAKGGEQNA